MVCSSYVRVVERVSGERSTAFSWVQGRGTLGDFEFAGPTGSLVNNGLISANISGQTLTVNPLNFTNGGTARASGGGVLTLSPTGSWTNSGLAEATSGSVLNIAPTLAWSNAGVIRLADAASTVNLNGSFTTAGLGTVDNAAGGALNLLGALNNTASTLTLTAATTEKPILQLELEAAARRARDDDAANFVDI